MADGNDQDLLAGLQQLLAGGAGPGGGSEDGSAGGGSGSSTEDSAAITPDFREQLIHCEHLVNRMGD